MLTDSLSMPSKAVLLPVLTLTTGILLGCSTPMMQAPTSYPEEIAAWRAERLENLTSDTGWLTLTGLYALEQGANTLGSAPDATVLLPPSAPSQAGIIVVEGNNIRLEQGVALTVDGEQFTTGQLIADDPGPPTVVESGTVSLFVISRGDQLLARVRDSASSSRGAFAGISSYPLNPGWRFTARFEPYEPIRQIKIANVLGQISDNPSWGAVVFEHQGEEYRLDALAEPGDPELFMIFADGTSGRETYGAGRYLYLDAPDANGMIDLDFNRAYNPPCAFTPFATCPLPPRQNRLALRIEAGERKYQELSH